MRKNRSKERERGWMDGWKGSVRIRGGEKKGPIMARQMMGMKERKQRK